ncbi:MAG TPA: class I SAM-dependent methyltransferase [Noviherbaspirillum sp.]|nr:class I SAM-dependent methyltransferase [Noviherbaspirillum sp.]
MQFEACPACLGENIKTIHRIATRDLETLYGREGLDVSRYFGATREIRLNKCLACDLGFFSPHCAGDDLFYEQLQKFDWYYQDDKPEYDYARKLVGDAQRVLEVGCGKGAFFSWLPESVEYTGLEFNDEAIRKARSAGLNVFKQPIEEHAKLEAGKYDVVCSFQVLEHIPAPRGFIRACVQALKPGGKLIFAVPAEDGFLGVAANAYLNMPPHHVLRWSDRALRHLAFREGLSVIELWHEPVAEFHREWHQETLARHYLVQLGLGQQRLVDRTLTGRVFSRLLRSGGIRDYFAAKAAKRFAPATHGHTVVLVASKPVWSEVHAVQRKASPDTVVAQ